MPEVVAIEVNNLSKNFGDLKAVDNVSLEIKQGEVFGFLGPNGSGKTTTIRMLCGLLEPSGGTGSCLGYDILSESHKIRNNIGYMTQKFSLYGDLTIKENITFVARLFRCENLKNTVDHQLEVYGLTDRQHQMAQTLSGGWKQRLALAACSISKPKLLMLDEPTAGVDPNARREFWSSIQRLAGHGITTMVSTHYMDEAIRCNRIAYILQGKLKVVGTCDEVIATSNLQAIKVKSNNNLALQEMIEHLPDVSSLAILGDALHISGFDKQKLYSIVREKDKKATIKDILPSLEDAFVSFAKEATKHQPLVSEAVGLKKISRIKRLFKGRGKN